MTKKKEVYLETRRSENEQDRKKSKQTEVIDQEILNTKALRQADETIKLPEHEFVTCVDKGEKENDMSLVSKAMTMKHKGTEKHIELRGSPKRVETKT